MSHVKDGFVVCVVRKFYGIDLRVELTIEVQRKRSILVREHR